MTKNLAFLALALGCGTAAMADITKGPDLGDFWFPVGPNSTLIYANSFIAEEDCTISDLGTWLNDQNSGGSSLRLEVWGDTGGSGPDASNIISSTGPIGASLGTGLTYNQFSASSGNLIGGNTYWFAVTGVGESGPGFWNVGGHTQNSVYNDNGTFWYSNDGSFFDGQNLTPEMAFSVICRIPTPGSAAVLGLGGLIVARRRRA
jgi:hypothetical protein